MQIELAYMILFAVIIVIGILGVTRKMSMGIALTGIGLGLMVSWILAPYMNIVISPIGKALFYGGDWTLAAILAVIHLATLILLVVMGAYNLAKSGGKIVWA